MTATHRSADDEADVGDVVVPGRIERQLRAAMHVHAGRELIDEPARRRRPHRLERNVAVAGRGTPGQPRARDRPISSAIRRCGNSVAACAGSSARGEMCLRYRVDGIHRHGCGQSSRRRRCARSGFSLSEMPVSASSNVRAARLDADVRDVVSGNVVAGPRIDLKAGAVGMPDTDQHRFRILAGTQADLAERAAGGRARAGPSSRRSL